MYKKLTKEERYTISLKNQMGFNQTGISIAIGVDKSTISRELRRNRGKKGYKTPKEVFFNQSVALGA